MGSDPKTSVVNSYGQSWDIPNLFIMGSSTFPTMSGFNPTLTIQALAYMSADAIVNRYRKNPARCSSSARGSGGRRGLPDFAQHLVQIGARGFEPARRLGDARLDHRVVAQHPG